MMKKLQKNIRERMNISRILDKKFIQSMKNFERIEKRFERMFWNFLTVRERSICRNNSFRVFYFIFFKAKFEFGRYIYWFFDKWVGFWHFLIKENLEGSQRVFLVLLLFIEWLGVSKRCLYFRLNDHVHFVL